jgi:hypothetical protein
LPESLDETYERILKDIRKPNQGHAHRLLQCLVVAVRPLRVEELAEVLAFEFNAEGAPKLNPGWRWEDQEEAVLSACSSLVTIVKDSESRVVQFSHFSVKEFLMADRLAEPMRDVSRYHIRLEAAHTILAQACLGVLLQLDDRVDRDNIKNFPLARYSAQHWVTHARAENVSSRIKEGMECLFDEDKPHFATWIWIFNGRSMHPDQPDTVPLYHAAMFGFRDLVEHLITEHPEHVNASGGKRSPLHAATDAGHANIVSMLIDHGADMEARSGSIIGGTPLNHAAWDGRFDIGQHLLDRGADIDARDDARNTPLMHAVSEGHVEFARMLLERGALIDAQDARGKTALHYVVQRGFTQVLRLLLEYGADVNVRDENGRSASQIAMRQRPGMVELFSKYCANSV